MICVHAFWRRWDCSSAARLVQEKNCCVRIVMMRVVDERRRRLTDEWLIWVWVKAKKLLFVSGSDAVGSFFFFNKIAVLLRVRGYHYHFPFSLDCLNLTMGLIEQDFMDTPTDSVRPQPNDCAVLTVIPRVLCKFKLYLKFKSFLTGKFK